MKIRIELHDSVIKVAQQNGRWLEIVFERFSLIKVKDKFGFEFQSGGYSPGVVYMRDVRAQTLPSAGPVSAGKVGIGDLSYDNCIPPDLHIKESCFFHLTQVNSESLIFAEELRIELHNSPKREIE